MEQEIIMPVKAKHFKGSRYRDVCNCPLANAAKEFFKVTYVNEGVNKMYVGKPNSQVLYLHDPYYEAQNHINKEHAATIGYDETVIFEIKLTSYENNV